MNQFRKSFQSTRISDVLYFIDKKGRRNTKDIDTKFSFLETSDGFDRVRRGQYAFHCDAQTGKRRNHYQKKIAALNFQK